MQSRLSGRSATQSSTGDSSPYLNSSPNAIFYHYWMTRLRRDFLGATHHQTRTTRRTFSCLIMTWSQVKMKTQHHRKRIRDSRTRTLIRAVSWLMYRFRCQDHQDSWTFASCQETSHAPPADEKAGDWNLSKHLWAFLHDARLMSDVMKPRSPRLSSLSAIYMLICWRLIWNRGHKCLQMDLLRCSQDFICTGYIISFSWFEVDKDTVEPKELEMSPTSQAFIFLYLAVIWWHLKDQPLHVVRRSQMQLKKAHAPQRPSMIMTLYDCCILCMLVW